MRAFEQAIGEALYDAYERSGAECIMHINEHSIYLGDARERIEAAWQCWERPQFDGLEES
jgi:hypothetical protein